MNIENHIRHLARSSYYQELYQASQDCSGIYLFDNQTNFSRNQYMFLHWLRIYSMLYQELYSFEWKNLDEAVLNDNDRCDAFLYWRRKHQEKELRKSKKKDTKDRPNMMKVFTGAKIQPTEGNK